MKLYIISLSNNTITIKCNIYAFSILPYNKLYYFCLHSKKFYKYQTFRTLKKVSKYIYSTSEGSYSKAYFIINLSFHFSVYFLFIHSWMWTVELKLMILLYIISHYIICKYLYFYSSLRTFCYLKKHIHLHVRPPINNKKYCYVERIAIVIYIG